MSVINKMLKDLDDRQEGPVQSNEPDKNGAGQPTNSTRSHPQKNTTSGVNLGVVSVLVVIAVLLAFIGWQLLQANASSQNGSNNNASNSKVAQTNNDNSQSGESNTQLSDQESTITVPQSRDEVDDVPPVPETDPDPAAELPKAPAPEEELNESEITPEPILEPELEPAIETTAEQTVVAQPESTTESVPPKATTNTLETKSQPEASFTIEKTSDKLTPEERIERLLDKARKAYEKGYITEAIEDLTKILTISDSNIEARTLLAGAWYGRGESNRAIAIINDGLQRYPLVEEWRTTASKIFFKENNLAGAFSYLNVELEDAGKEFYTLKGNLARQLKEFTAAESAYQQLTEMEPFVGNWWLGLAIAQDSQAKFEQALKSYQRVIEAGGVSPQSVSFAQQRIEALKG